MCCPSPSILTSPNEWKLHNSVVLFPIHRVYCAFYRLEVEINDYLLPNSFHSIHEEEGSDRYFDISIVRHLDSPTVSYTTYTCTSNYVMCARFLNFVYFFQIHGPNIEIHTLQIDSNNISIYIKFSSFFNFMQKCPTRTIELSNYHAVGLSIRAREEEKVFLPWMVCI